MSAAPKRLTYQNRADAPELYINETPSLWVHQGNLHITLDTSRPDHSGSDIAFDRIVVGRIVMPLAAAARLAEHLWAVLEKSGAALGKPSGTTTQ